MVPRSSLPWSILLLAALLGSRTEPVCALEAEDRKILILHSYHQGYKWTDEINRGILSVLTEESELRPYIEYMDTKRFYDERYLVQLKEIYRHKFAEARFEAILSTDDNSFNFLRRYRDELFPGTPVIFCGVNFFDPTDLKGIEGFTGVNEATDFQATLELALQLHPRARKILVINDTTTTGRKIHQRLLRILPAFEQIVEFELLEDLPMPTLLERLERSGPDQLVFYTLFFRDSTGQFFEYDESIRRIAGRCRMPIYGAWDFSLGHGIVGGKLASGYSQGEAAAHLLLRTLQAGPEEKLPVIMESPNRYMFDHRQLVRFGISPDALPQGSIVLHRPAPAYYRYRKMIWGSLGVIGLLSVIILSLALYIVLRRISERERLLLIHELEDKNTELERFVYTVSHDLKSPLITIQGFLGLLVEDIREGNTEEIEESTDRISHAVERMQLMLEELLVLSRIGRSDQPFEEVSLEDLAREAAIPFAQQLEGGELRIDISPSLPVVQGDRRRLLEVMQNLLNNAVRFMGDQPEPRVEIGHRQGLNGIEILIRDNGIGIEPRYRIKVFDLFERLNSEIDGTGIGLAIVRRVIEVHGGRIWIEDGLDGGGATFCFTVSGKAPRSAPGIARQRFADGS